MPGPISELADATSRWPLAPSVARARRLQHERFPYAGRNAPADEFLALLHRTGRAAALLPAEALRALAIGRHEGLAGVRLVLQRILVGVVPDAKLERIEIRRIGELVHRDLEQIHAGAGTGRAHVSRRRNVDRGDRVVELGVFARVRHASPVDNRLGMSVVARRRRRGAVDDGGKLAVAVRGERNELDAFRTVNMGEHLLARHRDSHGALEHGGGKDRQIRLILCTQA